MEPPDVLSASDAIGMAINAANSRTQDQLHIHIDCIRAEVRNALLARIEEITSRWGVLPVDLAGHVYRARWIDGAEPEPDPFILLADDARALGAPMRDETLALEPQLAGILFAFLPFGSKTVGVVPNVC